LSQEQNDAVTSAAESAFSKFSGDKGGSAW